MPISCNTGKGTYATATMVTAGIKSNNIMPGTNSCCHMHSIAEVPKLCTMVIMEMYLGDWQGIPAPSGVQQSPRTSWLRMVPKDAHHQMLPAQSPCLAMHLPSGMAHTEWPTMPTKCPSPTLATPMTLAPFNPTGTAQSAQQSQCWVDTGPMLLLPRCHKLCRVISRYETLMFVRLGRQSGHHRPP